MLKISAKNILFLILYSIPNTILSFGILFIINNVISGNIEFQGYYMGIVFGSIVVYTYLLNIIFQKRLNQYSYKILYENERKIFDKFLNTPLITLEKMGSHRFYTAIEDIRVFSLLPDVVTQSINSILMLLLCMLYLFTLSGYGALVIVVLIIGIGGIYFLVMNMMSPKIAILRKYNDEYYKYVQDIVKGFKELKINPKRRDNLRNNHLNPNRGSAKELDLKVNYIFLSINLISQYGLYMVIGVILFLLPAINLLKKEDVLSYVVILLFINGPINNLINLQSIYTRFMVANRRIVNFLNDFKNESTEPYVATGYHEFSSLKFSDIEFNHQNELLEKNFILGPVNVTINSGETIFIVGGNGSGKSTFINMLTGLYEPSNGEIQMNNTIVNSKAQLQDTMAAVFTENHIFSFNYDDFTLKNNKHYQELLELMKMDKVVVDDDEESARRSFSKGQSKRMSLILALLEDKPILVLDEWAADQDPHFRKYFYENLLPKLKEEGKTIIAVTHDDTYFKHADRILKFDYGKIIMDKKITDNIELDSIWK
ncbi:cyclic peptide export ABC transporter [Flavobacterium sp. JAS]|uniref:cyclic peptide export ABC transporter n=1 Tax=Flavobacterium sp. JAS TaxID=2897329 RepID=UPI001E50043C|nr:cyclic peptide export ABC transporter [Flavobacterium sp. JAS]MCD0472715.1 cyclic peptide export ABC transporter [Flavobacterium sp. JAS]